MLVIRLQRTGRRNAATFRMVVAEHTAPVKGKFLEVVGHYLPTRDPVEIEVKPDRITHWVSVGAVPSNTVARLLVKNGMKEMEKYVKQYTKKKPRKEVEEAPEASTPPPPTEEAPKDVPTETPAEETPKEESAPTAEKPAEKEKKKPDEEKKEEPTPAEEAPTKEETPATDEAPEQEEKQAEEPVEEGDSDKKE